MRGNLWSYNGQMIRSIYSSQKLWRGHQAFWCILVFLVNSLAFWYIVLKCCFRTLCPRPPAAVRGVALFLILADRIYPLLSRSKLSWLFAVDLVVWLLLLLSLVLPDENVVCFMGLAVAVNLLDILYLKELMFDMVRRIYWVYKIYIIVKIVYWIILYGHVIGCIFYAIDIYLIDQEYFGPFAQNPANYYHGTLLAYTPILMFENLNRYAYAMYYSYALVSTIAFGDIIGKNYIQDIYVGILIILSTIVISLIIEQMYIIFRRKKTIFLELLNHVRFLSERLKGYQQIPKTFRLEIINYLIQTNWRYISEYPAELETSKQFKIKIIMDSVIANPQLPAFYQKYLLHQLKLKHLPKGVQLSSNVPQRQELMSFLVTKGQFWVGYTSYSGRPVGGYLVEKDGVNFGIEEALVGTNDLYKLLAIRTVSSGVVLSISKSQIQQILGELTLVDYPCQKPIEHYQIAKDCAMFRRSKYQCHLCDTKLHTLLNCPKCHYIVDEAMILEIAKSKNERRSRMRRYRKSLKLRGGHLETFQPIEARERGWRLKEIARFRDIFNRIRSIDRQEETPFQKWHRWNIYGQDLLPYGFSKDVSLQPEHHHQAYKSMILTVHSPSRMPTSLLR